MASQATDQDIVNLPLKTLLERQGLPGLVERVLSMFDPWYCSLPHALKKQTNKQKKKPRYVYTFSAILWCWFLRVPFPQAQRNVSFAVNIPQFGHKL